MPLSKWSAWGKQVMWLTNKLCFFFNYLYVSSHKHTNLKERYHAPLILYKRAQLKHVNSLLYVCMLNWSQRLKWQFSVRCERHMTAAKFKIINKKKMQERNYILSLLHYWINNCWNIYAKYLSAVMYVQLNFAMSCCFYAIF